MKRGAALLMIAGVLSFGGTAHADITPCPSDGISIPVGADIQSYLTAGAQGDSFCLDAGTYALAAKLRPRSDQRLYGVPGYTVIDGGGVVKSLFDGCSLVGSIGNCASTDPTGVQLHDLTLTRATLYDVRTGSGWLLDGVAATTSAQYGITVRGTGTVVQNSSAISNGRFGITASYTIGGSIQDSEVAFNNSPVNPPGYSGATHFTNTLDLQVLGNVVHDNYGRGIWFDIDSKGALVQDNTVQGELTYPYANTPYAVGDGIRIEISCNITVNRNTVSANQGPQIPLDGSDNNLVTDNSVTSPPGQPGIRVAPQDQRTTQPPGSGNCDSAPKTAVNNTITGNTITMQGHLPASDYNGLQQKNSASNATGTTFDANSYHLTDCAARLFHWWNGAALVKIDFLTLQGTYHQEAAGSCLSP